ncbi:MAG: putative DNA binding domain-containing protein [Candidatus Margulisbacteria bacterium]|jgi:predicted HTH transcriptional regulator|nr:putative DNA binding domain-containing protein [Candidatus Margulisiibacteriota bacterium]
MVIKTETSRLEYKEKVSDSLEKDTVAFLNAEGGEIYIGIKNNGAVAGVVNPDKLQLQIKDRLIQNICPSILNLLAIQTEARQKKTVVRISLKKGLEPPYYIKQKGMSESGCFIRVGASAQPMATAMIHDIYSKRMPISLKHMEASYQGLTFEQLRIYYEEKGKKLQRHFASTLDFLNSDGKYNYAAFLFADNNNISVRVAKYWGRDKVKLRELKEYGECSLLKAVHAVLDKFEIENITQARIIGLGPREEKRIVNNTALREAVINAFAHNDYSTGETPIFEIFEDRFEITSYGGLVRELSEAEFFAGVSKLRNPEIMRVFRDIELVERLGSGMHRILETYDRSIFKITPHILRVSFKFDRGIDEIEWQKIQDTSKSKEKTKEKTKEKIIKAIQNDSLITIQKLAEILGLTTQGVEWNIARLKKQGIIRRVGPDKGGYWEVLGGF